jgi:hypothetical protein
VYGIVRTDSSRVPEGLVGLDGTEVRLVGHQRVAAAVGDIALDRPPGRRADLVAYTKVLDTLAEAGPVVPVRFGSVVPDDDVVVADLLAPRVDRFDELLSSLEGRAQFNLRATYHEAGILQEVVAENREIAELRELTRDRDPDSVHPQLVRLGELVAHAVEGKRDHDAVFVLEQVRALVDAEVVRTGKGVEQVFDASFLVADDRRAEFEELLESLAEGMHERIGLQLTGPLPPYDFVGGDAWD